MAPKSCINRLQCRDKETVWLRHMPMQHGFVLHILEKTGNRNQWEPNSHDGNVRGVNAPLLRCACAPGRPVKTTPKTLRQWFMWRRSGRTDRVHVEFEWEKWNDSRSVEKNLAGKRSSISFGQQAAEWRAFVGRWRLTCHMGPKVIIGVWQCTSLQWALTDDCRVQKMSERQRRKSQYLLAFYRHVPQVQKRFANLRAKRMQKFLQKHCKRRINRHFVPIDRFLCRDWRRQVAW